MLLQLRGYVPHYDVVLMFKFLALQYRYRLSDKAMQDDIIDSNAFQYFLGLGCAARVPDSRAIRNFCIALGADGVRSLFNDFNRQLVGMGAKVNNRPIIAFSFIEAQHLGGEPQDQRGRQDAR